MPLCLQSSRRAFFSSNWVQALKFKLNSKDKTLSMIAFSYSLSSSKGGFIADHYCSKTCTGYSRSFKEFNYHWRLQWFALVLLLLVSMCTHTQNSEHRPEEDRRSIFDRQKCSCRPQRWCAPLSKQKSSERRQAVVVISLPIGPRMQTVWVPKFQNIHSVDSTHARTVRVNLGVITVHIVMPRFYSLLMRTGVRCNEFVC